MYVDEMTNEELQRDGASEHRLQLENSRIDREIMRLVTTGADLSYFIERQRIVRSLLQNGIRDPRLP
jgi:hypothetical protein